MGCYLQWQHHPRYHAMITDAVGVDGLREIGGRMRHEIGTKLNPLHIWAAGVCPRRWGAASPSNLATRRPTRFQDERTQLSEDPAARKSFQRFNGSTQLASFLLHFDNRNGVADSGPYLLPGGGWMVVRDHVLNDPAYPWSEEVADLPWAVTLVMFFQGGQQVEASVVDIGTLFTKPANYLKYLTRYAVYLREEEDTPVSDIRLLAEDELAPLASRAEQGAARLYPRIAGMSDRAKILAGCHVYFTDFVGSSARPRVCGTTCWQRSSMIDASVERGYGPIVTEGRALDLLGRLWASAEAMIHLNDAAPESTGRS